MQSHVSLPSASLSTPRTPGTQFDRAGLEVLDRRECLRLLATAQLGRIAINVGALPMILPVHFALIGDHVAFRVGADTVLDAATDGNVVAFEVDGTDSALRSDWSVSIVAVAAHLDDVLGLSRRSAVSLPSWISALHPRFVSISTERLSGRRANISELRS